MSCQNINHWEGLALHTVSEIFWITPLTKGHLSSDSCSCNTPYPDHQMNTVFPTPLLSMAPQYLAKSKMSFTLIFTVRPHTVSWDASPITPQGKDYIPITLRPPNLRSVLSGMSSQWLVKVQLSSKDPNGKAKLENEDRSIDFPHKGMHLSYQYIEGGMWISTEHHRASFKFA